MALNVLWWMFAVRNNSFTSLPVIAKTLNLHVSQAGLNPTRTLPGCQPSYVRGFELCFLVDTSSFSARNNKTIVPPCGQWTTAQTRKKQCVMTDTGKKTVKWSEENVDFLPCIVLICRHKKHLPAALDAFYYEHNLEGIYKRNATSSYISCSPTFSFGAERLTQRRLVKK